MKGGYKKVNTCTEDLFFYLSNIQNGLTNLKEDRFMSESFSEELKKELVKQAVKNLEDPFKMLTVKDVAKDLYMGENKTNEIFNREDFPSVNIGKTRKIQKIAYILWKMEKRIDVI